MKKTTRIFVLLSGVLFTPSLGGTDQDCLRGSKRYSPSVLEGIERGPGLAGLRAAARERITEHFRRAEYGVSGCERALLSGKTRTYRALNRNQSLRVRFGEQGVQIFPVGRGEPSRRLEMTLSGYGYGGAMEPARSVGSGAIEVSGNRVEYRRRDLTEWYVNDERGLEHGVTLNQAPVRKGPGPLVLQWAVSGPLVPRVEHEGRAIVFSWKGEPLLRYDDLKAWDATGRRLAARLAVRTGGAQGPLSRIVYMVDDTEASYPVMIDPMFTRVRKLLPIDITDDWFGYSVSISGDTVVVGAPEDDDNGDASGAAYVFSRHQGGADNWGQVRKIVPADGAPDDEFGSSVSVSGDTLVVGAQRFIPNSGSAYVFDRHRGGEDNWGFVKKTTPRAGDGSAGDRFGSSISISADTVVVGAHGDDGEGEDSGSAYVFVRVASLPWLLLLLFGG